MENIDEEKFSYGVKRNIDELLNDQQVTRRQSDVTLPRKVICLSKISGKPSILTLSENPQLPFIISKPNVDLQQRRSLPDTTEHKFNFDINSLPPNTNIGRKIICLPKNTTNPASLFHQNNPALNFGVDSKQSDESGSGSFIDESKPNLLAGGNLSILNIIPSNKVLQPLHNNNTGLLSRKVVIISNQTSQSNSSDGSSGNLTNSSENDLMKESLESESKSTFKFISKPLREREDKKFQNLIKINTSNIFNQSTDTSLNQVFTYQPKEIKIEKLEEENEIKDVKPNLCKFPFSQNLDNNIKTFNHCKTEIDLFSHCKTEIEENYETPQRNMLLEKVMEQEHIRNELYMKATNPDVIGATPHVKLLRLICGNVGEYRVFNFSADFHVVYLKQLFIIANYMEENEDMNFTIDWYTKIEGTSTLREAYADLYINYANKSILPDVIDLVVWTTDDENYKLVAHFVTKSFEISEGIEIPQEIFPDSFSDDYHEAEMTTNANKSRKNSKVKTKKLETHMTQSRRLQLWQFILVTLLENKNKETIQWVGNDGSEFLFVETHGFSQLWSNYKGKDTKVCYSNLSRSIRNYYIQHIMAKSEKSRFSYKFLFGIEKCIGYTVSEMRRLYEAFRGEESPDPNHKDFDKFMDLQSKLSEPISATKGKENGSLAFQDDCEDAAED